MSNDGHVIGLPWVFSGCFVFAHIRRESSYQSFSSIVLPKESGFRNRSRCVLLRYLNSLLPNEDSLTDSKTWVSNRGNIPGCRHWGTLMVSNITRGRNINLNDHNPTYSCILVPRADDDVRRHSSGKQFVPRPVSHPLVSYILFVFLCALRGPAWAVASYSNSQPATGIPQTIISKPGPWADGKRGSWIRREDKISISSLYSENRIYGHRIYGQIGYIVNTLEVRCGILCIK